MEQFEEAIQKRVAAGAAFLDENEPGWAEKIYGKVEIADCFECVMGQLYGMYFYGLGFHGLSEEEAFNLGFNRDCHSGDSSKIYFESLLLNKAWKQVIKERRRTK